MPAGLPAQQVVKPETHVQIEHGDCFQIRKYSAVCCFISSVYSKYILFRLQYTHIMLDIDCWQATDRLKANPKIPTGDRLSHPQLKLLITVERSDLAFATRCRQDTSFFLAEVQNQACWPSSWGVPAHGSFEK